MDPEITPGGVFMRDTNEMNANDRVRVSRRTLVAGAGGTAIAAIGAKFIAPGALAQETEVPEGFAPGETAMTPTAIGPAVPPEYTDYAQDWPVANQNIAGHRVATTAISSENIDSLEVAWEFSTEEPGLYGAWTSNPLIQGDTVYVQDLACNVHALDRATGEVRWSTKYSVPSVGPNGIAVAYGKVFGAAGMLALAYCLDAETGEELWSLDMTPNQRERVDGTPSVYDNTVYISTTPSYSGGSRGILYALDCETGAVLWYWDTLYDNAWNAPRLNAGGGVWYTVSFDEDGNLYFGTGNPSPLPGSPEYPNGESRPGDNLWTNAMVSLSAETGGVRWYYQDAPHDLFDLDFQLMPILTTITDGGEEVPVAIGAGKTGHIVACNRENGRVVWKRTVAKQQNAWLTEVPAGEQVEVFPGALGGVETPMAIADGVLYAAVVEQAGVYTDSAWSFQTTDYGAATGTLVALDVNDGTVLWTTPVEKMPLAAMTVANDLVFSGDLSGQVFAYLRETGEQVWSRQFTAGVNAPLAVAGDLLLVPAGAPYYGEEEIEVKNQLVALRLPGGAPAASPEATPAG
jgi:alcohol dehydrogenase (cytochrome c)